MRRQGMPNRARCHKIPWLFRMVRDTARSAVHERREQGRGKRWSAPPKREIEMQHDRVRKASGGKWLGIAAGISLILGGRSEAHTSELQSLMRISYSVFCFLYIILLSLLFFSSFFL